MEQNGIGELLDNPMIYFALGIGGLFFGFFFLLIGGIVGTGTEFGPMFIVCGAAGLIPGVVLLAIARKKQQAIRDLDSLGEVLQAYRRIKMSEVARKLGVNEFEAERRVARAIDMGFVKGYIDRQTHEFFTLESVGQVVHHDSCPKCGAPRVKLCLEGERVKCEACGYVL